MDMPWGHLKGHLAHQILHMLLSASPHALAAWCIPHGGEHRCNSRQDKYCQNGKGVPPSSGGRSVALASAGKVRKAYLLQGIAVYLPATPEPEPMPAPATPTPAQQLMVVSNDSAVLAYPGRHHTACAVHAASPTVHTLTWHATHAPNSPTTLPLFFLGWASTTQAQGVLACTAEGEDLGYGDVEEE
ncbi:hypothetical protein B0H10DRAFT_1968985 [Mycena sp. CBHHK59/15]|nr:hypothetical protein B0H10DRAFT_1968985 [Mycena sp. CBHHK59/15]